MSQSKPRIRMIYDELGSPKELRVILSQPTANTKSYNELGNLIIVEADENGQNINTIKLNCQILGGKEIEKACFDLLMKIKSNEEFFPHLPLDIKQAVATCSEKLGSDRINNSLCLIEEERKNKWGILYDLCKRNLNLNRTKKEAQELCHYIESNITAKNVDIILELLEWIRETQPKTINSRGYVNLIDNLIRNLKIEVFEALTQVISFKIKNVDLDPVTWKQIMLTNKLTSNPQKAMNFIKDVCEHLETLYNEKLSEDKKAEYISIYCYALDSIVLFLDQHWNNLSKEFFQDLNQFLLKISETGRYVETRQKANIIRKDCVESYALEKAENNEPIQNDNNPQNINFNYIKWEPIQYNE